MAMVSTAHIIIEETKGTLTGKKEILQVRNISKSYGKHEVLKQVSFSACPGGFVGIIGANGSGKSTLLSILAGILKPDSGEVYAYGKDLLKDKSCASRFIGYVPQENPLIADLSVRDNLRLWYCDSPFDMDKELKDGFLKQLGLNEYQKKTVKKLSGGMKKRVSIGIAIHNKPNILMLDEPGAALDFAAKKYIRDYLKTYVAEGGAVIIVTHDEEELRLCDRVYELRDGMLKEINKGIRQYAF